MYAGHFGIALGAYAARPRVALAWYVGAALLCDLASAALGMAHVADAGAVYSHGLPQIALAAVLVGTAAWRVSGNAGAGAAVGATVLSHLPADYVTSTRLAVWAHGPEIGLGVYRRPVLDFVVEGTVIVAGWWLYRRAVRTDTRRAWPQYVMLAALLALQAWFCTLGVT